MNEFFKFLLERLGRNRLGSELLVVFAVVVGLFSLIFYLTTTPQAMSVLRAPVFVASTVLVVGAWVATLCWRYLARKLRIISAAAVLCAAGVGAYGAVRPAHVDRVSVIVVFDSTIDMPPDAISALGDRLRSQLFDVVVDDRPINFGSDSVSDSDRQTIDDALARKPGQTPESPTSALPVLITARRLENSEWTNLLSLTWPDLVIISTHDVGDSPSLGDDTVGRYVATSVALESLTAYAMQRNTQLLPDRSPGANRGCLSDFHRLRDMYIQKAQHPALCDAEADGIRSVFGPTAITALNAVFTRISQ